MPNPQHVMIAGGSGFIGGALQAACAKREIAFTLITRDPQSAHEKFPNAKAISWQELGPDSFQDVDALVNLTGAGIADKRWSDARLKVLLDSRVDTTKKLISALKGADARPAVLVQGSAIGIYGKTDHAVDESSALGTQGHLPRICKEWEAAVADAPVRTVLLRTGVVLGHGGGALPTMAKPFKMFLGAPLGSGKQYMSWIHLDDIVGLIFEAIENDKLSGPLNGTAPNPVTNRHFSKALAKALHRPCLPIGIPSWVLWLVMGRMARELVLESQQVLSKAASSYDFKFPTLEAALADLYP